MDQSDVPFEFSHTVDGEIVIQDLTGWDGNPEYTDAFAPVWEEYTSRDSIKGAVTLFGPDITLDKETQKHFADVWGPYADQVGIDRLAFVADGIKGMAINSNVETTMCDIKSFKDKSEAIDWAKSA